MKWHARADGASVLLLCNSFLQAATGRGGGVGKPSEMNKAVHYGKYFAGYPFLNHHLKCCFNISH